MEIDNIYLGDCYELIKQVPDKSIDLIITDPPYEIEGGGSAGCFGNRNYFKEYHDLGVDEHKSHEDRTDRSCAGFNYSLLEELERVMKKTNIYLWCSKRQLLPLLEFYKDKVVDVLVWCKTNPTPLVNGIFLPDIEYCVYAREKGTQLRGGYKNKRRWFVSSTNTEDKSDYKHPTIKPLERIKDFVIMSSDENDIVLDPFIGSGTTAVACKELKRHYIGFEINPKFHQIAVDRVKGIKAREKEQGFEQLKLF